MGDETHLIWGIGLLAASLLLLFVEIFIPSGGLIALLAGGAAIAGIWQLFLYETIWGVIGILGVLFMAPVVISFGLKVLPSTPIGRKMFFGDSSQEAEDRQREEETAEIDSMHALVGMEGEASTDLHPVGVIRLEGRRYDALAEGAFIDAGTKVRVTVADGMQVKVRPVN